MSDERVDEALLAKVRGVLDHDYRAEQQGRRDLERAAKHGYRVEVAPNPAIARCVRRFPGSVAVREDGGRFVIRDQKTGRAYGSGSSLARACKDALRGKA